MAYTTITEVRSITGLTESQVSTIVLTELISQATAIINSKINVRVREEKVQYLDPARKNDIHDGETVKFYPKHCVTNYLADQDNSGKVDEKDIQVYKVDNDDVRTELTVESVDIEEGSFTLSSAPGTDTRDMYIWYSYSFYNVNTPDKLIELLTKYLVASYAYLHKDHDLPSSTKFGNIQISRSQIGMAYNRYSDRYNELLQQVVVPCNKPRVSQYKEMI